jgi:tetratricopeptide (TPR) repeat protein
LIGQTVSHYRILEKLGEGGMGIVYLAEDTHLGRRVAIKFLTSQDKHYRARFLREARAVSALSHANIAAVFDYGETADQQPYIVMEFVKGHTISDLLRDDGLTLAQSVEITTAVAQALAEAHHAGIVHRDIKPSNVVLNERGQVKVLDFGLVKHLFEEPSVTADSTARTLFSTRTRSDVIVGTPLYLSPEQASGKPVDGRSDLFSLGALLYECITGQSAFSGSSVLEIGAQVLHVNPPLPSTINSNIPAALDRITMKALEKKIEARYQSAEDLLKDLRALSPTLSGDAHRTLALDTRDTPLSKPMATGALATLTQTLQRPRLSLGAFIVAAVVIGLGVWGIIHFWPASHYEPLAAAKKWYDAGTDALRNGAYFAATKSLEQAVITDDKFALAHARLAEAFAELEYTDKAKDELLRVSALVPDRSRLPRSEALYLEAVNASVARDFPSAIRSYDDIARLSAGEPQVYIDLGRAYERNDQNGPALENYLKAISLNGQDATAHLRAGIIFSSKQDVAKAREAFDKALELFTALSNVEGQAEVFRQYGILFKRSGKFAEAETQFQRELDTARTLGNESQQVTALLDLSSLEYSKGATVQAREYATQAIQFAQQHQLEGLVAEALLHLANSFYGQGNYVDAEKYFKQAIESARAAKYRFREATGLRDLGSLYIQQLRADEGLPLIEQAKNFFQQGNYIKEASFCLTSIGRVKRRKGDYEGALQAFQQELQIAQQGGDQPQIAFSYGEIASVMYEQERFPEALEQYEKANSINQPIGNRISLAFNRANRGDLLWRLGRYREAQQAFTEALSIANDPESGYKQLIPEIERTSAQMALSQRHFPEAKEKAEHALALAGSEYKTVIIEAKYTLGLAQALNGSGRDGKANCEESIKLATDGGDAGLLSRAMLALAESALSQGDARAALENATAAQARFAKAGQQESEWRAWLIAGLASQQLNERDQATRQLAQAKTVLSQLEQRWGTEAFKVYLTRPDIQVYYKQLG